MRTFKETKKGPVIFKAKKKKDGKETFIKRLRRHIDLLPIRTFLDPDSKKLFF